MQTPLSSHFQSTRRPRSPQEALLLFRCRLRNPPPAAPSDSHAAVLAIKSISPLPSHIHAHLLKTNLLSHIHVSSALLHAYSLSSLPSARRLFDEIPNPNLVTTTTMITCLSTHENLPAARSLFDRIPVPDTVSWSAMIHGYVRLGDRPTGLSLFRKMMTEGVLKPYQSTLVTVLSACTDTGSPRLVGRSVHSYAFRNFTDIDEWLATKLIDMYTKSGSVGSAFRVFDMRSQKNKMHWTAMICGLASHGHGSEAVELFEAMILAGVDPDEITFTCVLNACCNAGMVERGQEYFRKMVDEFGFEPGIHHYGCLVDLLSKAGRLEEAYRVLESMWVEPNVVVLTSLLAGCKMHRNFEVAEKVIERVREMVSPENDGGVYTLISNLYAAEGRWSDVERMRRLMDRCNVRKNRGAAYIEMGEVGASVVNLGESVGEWGLFCCTTGFSLLTHLY